MSTRLSSAGVADGTVLFRGFSDPHPLSWYCAPDGWPVPKQDHLREGRDGQCAFEERGGDTPKALVIWPPAKKDFWRKTYYKPVFVKDDGPCCYTTLDYLKGGGAPQQQFNHYTVETAFELVARRQFDQAGLYCRLDAEHWMKAGIEVVDGRPRVSCVVTNVYSDWSTQHWSHYTTTTADGTAGGKPNVVVVSIRMRLHCRGTSFVIEAAPPVADASWELVRIAHMSLSMQSQQDDNKDDEAVRSTAWQGPAAPEGALWAGVFACSPEDQQGCKATFSDFIVTAGSHFDHDAQGNTE